MSVSVTSLWHYRLVLETCGRACIISTGEDADPKGDGRSTQSRIPEYETDPLAKLVHGEQPATNTGFFTLVYKSQSKYLALITSITPICCSLLEVEVFPMFSPPSSQDSGLGCLSSSESTKEDLESDIPIPSFTNTLHLDSNVSLPYRKYLCFSEKLPRGQRYR
ncbi:hypothetical protein Q9233_002071 [Columba guinea]|nr:hypothetical protein Q9233_002071 [Columba guinea]